MSDWLTLTNDPSPLVLRKEVIYEAQDVIKGVWLSKSEVVSGIRFDVTEARLEEMARQVSAMVSNKVEIPLTRGHKDWQKSEKRLGKVIGARVLNNEASKPALFLDFLFDSEASREEARAVDVSIGLDEEPIVLDGKTYTKPLRHVASTSVPVIQELEPWSQPEDEMDLTPILAELNLANESELLAGVQGLKTKLAALEEKVAALPKIELSNEQISPVLVKGHVDLRKLKIDTLVAGHRISPAIGASIAKSFVTDKRVGLELSNGDGNELFDAVLAIAEEASKNPPIAPKGGTVELSHEGVSNDETQKFLEARRKAKAEFDKQYGK